MDGRFLIETYKLKPGPLIGKLLDIVREAQAAGEIDDRQAALEMIEEFLEKQDAP